jgi:hypothetical protein
MKQLKFILTAMFFFLSFSVFSQEEKPIAPPPPPDQVPEVPLPPPPPPAAIDAKVKKESHDRHSKIGEPKAKHEIPAPPPPPAAPPKKEFN